MRALSASAWMGPPPGSCCARRAIFESWASILPMGSGSALPPSAAVASWLPSSGGLSDCVDATVTTCCCISMTAAVGGGWGSCCGVCCGGGGGCRVVCWWKTPSRLRCMNMLWSPPSECPPAACVVVVVLVVSVLANVEPVGVGLPVVVVVVVVVGGLLLPPPMVLPSLTAAKGSGFGGGGCCCCG